MRRIVPIVAALSVMGFLVAVLAGGCARESAPVPIGAGGMPPLPRVVIETDDQAVRDQMLEAQAAAEAAPNDADASGRLGMVYEVYQYPAAALVCYERASRLAPTAHAWPYLAGRLERGFGSAENARRWFQAALERAPGNAPVLMALGEMDLEAGALDGARARFQAARDANPRAIAPRFGLARVAAEVGDHESAQPLLEEIAAAAPSYAPALYALGMSYRALGRLDDAERAMAAAAQGNQSPPDVDPVVATMMQHHGGVHRAYLDGHALFQRGALEEARVALEEVIRAQPDHYGALAMLGQTAMRLNRPGEAMTYFERTLALNPTNTIVSRPYALLLHRAGRSGEAEQILQSVIDAGGDLPDDYHVLGAIISRDGSRVRESARLFALALQRSPAHAEARRALRSTLPRVAAEEGAADWLAGLSEEASEVVEIWFELGRVRADAGETAGAIEAWERALELDANIPGLARRLDVLRRQSGG